MIYGNLHAINSGVSWVAIAGATDYNADYVRQEVTAYQRGEKHRLPDNLAKALQNSLPAIHNEIALHTYTSDLFEGIYELRQREDQARALFTKIDTSATTVEEFLELWEAAQKSIMGVFVSGTVDQALYLNSVDPETLNAKQRTVIYLGAAVLHSMLILWEDAAKAMQKIQAEFSEDKTLDFLALHLDPISVVDLAETALSLYQLVDAELVSLIRNQRAVIQDIKTSLVEIILEGQRGAKETEEPELKKRLLEAQLKFDLIEQDRAIVNMNIASISSHAEDWSDPDHSYLVNMGLSAGEARKRLICISGLCGMTMSQALPLMKRYKRNLLVARNLAYMALQNDVADVLAAATEHLVEELGIDPLTIWSFRIANREPLNCEKDIANKFKNGQPIILKAQEVA